MFHFMSFIIIVLLAITTTRKKKLNNNVHAYIVVGRRDLKIYLAFNALYFIIYDIFKYLFLHACGLFGLISCNIYTIKFIIKFCGEKFKCVFKIHFKFKY